MKKIVSVQDISCYGQCSLTVALPVLSAYGIETAILPSAILSTHTGGFTGFTVHDLTEEMPKIVEHDVLQKLLNYLTDKGYPQDCLLMNYKLGKYRADLVITNPETHEPLQIFVYQSAKKNMTTAKQQLKDFINEAAKKILMLSDICCLQMTKNLFLRW